MDGAGGGFPDRKVRGQSLLTKNELRVLMRQQGASASLSSIPGRGRKTRVLLFSGNSLEERQSDTIHFICSVTEAHSCLACVNGDTGSPA